MTDSAHDPRREYRSPYRGNPRHTFWKASVQGRPVDRLRGLYTKRFTISPADTVCTAGSCFAQHLSRYMRRSGLHVLDAEPAPANVPAEMAAAHAYGVYSARYGNLYYVRQLLQLAQEVFGESEPAEAVWENRGRFFDALRPAVEPEGLSTPTAVRRHRERHLEAVRRVFTEADVFVFTLGLTEGWEHIASGTVFPTAPGTIAGDYDPDVYRLHNFTVAEIVEDFIAFRSLVHQVNPGLKFLLTVSPVPLAATATGQNVLVATTYSKAVLRAACGELTDRFDDIDYFPSYELVTSHAPGNVPFDETGRNVRSETVDMVMSYFLAEHGPKERSRGESPGDGAGDESVTTPVLEPKAGPAPDREPLSKYAATDEMIFCEEALLEAFSEQD